MIKINKRLLFPALKDVARLIKERKSELVIGLIAKAQLNHGLLRS